jgi:hypothetical protein
MHSNNATNLHSRNCFAAVSGIAAGVLGLTGVYGFVFYVIASMLLSFLIWSVMTGFQAKSYFKQTKNVAVDEVFGNMLVGFAINSAMLSIRSSYAGVICLPEVVYLVLDVSFFCAL